MKKKKLTFKKEAITNLSNPEMNNLRGGNGFNSEAVIDPADPAAEADPYATEKCNNDCIGSFACGNDGSGSCEDTKKDDGPKYDEFDYETLMCPTRVGITCNNCK